MRCPFAHVTDERARCMGGCWSSGSRAHYHRDARVRTHNPTRTLLSVTRCRGARRVVWRWGVDVSVKCLVLRARIRNKTSERCDVTLRGSGLYSQCHACSRPVGVRPALRHGHCGQDPGGAVITNFCQHCWEGGLLATLEGPCPLRLAEAFSVKRVGAPQGALRGYSGLTQPCDP